MKNWLKKPRGERRGVVISGAYGMDNAGDDAVLAAIVAALRQLDRDMPVTVICRSSAAVARRYQVRALGRLDLFGWLRAMGGARLFLLGGGSLLQDVTSRRSLWFYLLVLRAAKAMGCAAQLYGGGVGPIRGERARRRTAAYLDRYADAVTVRDRKSLETLRAWGVTEPKLLLTADPALAGESVPGPREEKAGFALRPWPGFQDRVPAFAAAARYVWERYGLAPAFFCLAPEDRQAAQAVCGALEGVPCEIAEDPGRAGRMAVTVSMRLHGAVFALAGGTRAAAVSYDPKVSAFCREAGLPWIELADVTERDLCGLIDRAMGLDEEALAAAAAALRAREKSNIQTAAALLSP